MIRPVSITTNNVARELLRIATQNSVPSSKLYLKINSISTFVKVGDSDSVEIEYEKFNKYKDEKFLRDKNVKFVQEYNVDIKSQPEGYPFKDMFTKIDFEDKATSAYLTIKKGSKLKYYDKLYSDFLEYITEQKLRSNIMIYLFDTDCENAIKEFVNVIAKIKHITFKEDKKILVSQGLKEIESVHAETLMLIEDKHNTGEEDNQGRVDYADRGFLISCVEGEELFEFNKPQQGEHGRTCRGDIIEVEIVDLSEKPEFKVDKTIEVQDSFENIKFLSTKSGYLIKSGDTYDVSNSIDVSEISFKTTGTINTDLDTEISINVVKNNPLEDAIEEGMHVKVQNLSIDGSIGPKTKIEARNISITGQTHNDSFIQCMNADIGLHKGKVVGRKVEVKTLEGGEIVADTAIIKNAIRGTIKAKIIEIDTLGSHVVLKASQYIQVRRVKGEENSFIIDPLISSGFDDNKEEDATYLKKLEGELKLLFRTFKEMTLKIKTNLEPCEKIKVAIIKSKNQGITISTPLIQKFKLCQLLKVRYKKLKEDIEYKKSQHKKIKDKQLSSGTGILDAKIILSRPIKGYNHITYKLTKPSIEIKLNTDERMTKKIFKLIEDEDGVYKIVNVNE
jgi:hypothetical protein